MNEELKEKIKKAKEEWTYTGKNINHVAKMYGLDPFELKKIQSEEKWRKNRIRKGRGTESSPIEGLPDKEALFVIEYLKTSNVIKAYMKSHGVNVKEAATHAHRLRSKASVSKAIDEYAKQQAEHININSSQLVQRLIDIANADINDYAEFGVEKKIVLDQEMNVVINPKTGQPMYKDQNFLHLKDSATVDGTLVSHVQVSGNSVTIKMPDKQKAIEKLLELTDYDGEREFKQQLEIEKLRIAEQRYKVENEERKEDIIMQELTVDELRRIARSGAIEDK